MMKIIKIKCADPERIGNLLKNVKRGYGALETSGDKSIVTLTDKIDKDVIIHKYIFDNKYL